jgi:hypothetical protein
LGSSLRDRRRHSEILPVLGGSQSKMAIEAEMAAGRQVIAARNLTQLMSWSSDSDEPAYLLGICEQKRGLNRAAVDARARVTPGSSFALATLFRGLGSGLGSGLGNPRFRIRLSLVLILFRLAGCGWITGGTSTNNTTTTGRGRRRLATAAGNLN